MKILHISDTHGCHRRLHDLLQADIVVHSGDFTMNGSEQEALDFMNWFCDLPHPHKIFICGNHDECLYGATIDGLDGNVHYLHDMRICQRWAVLNRKLISLLLMRFFPDVAVLEEFESVHNYISDENIIRKGSISAAVGERCIIPLNMRDGSLLCTGRGNPDWNYSAPHGAGRVLSRTQAYEKITMEDFEASMQGIYSESVNDFTRDESPMVYKPASEIIANIGNTVTIDTIIRPIFNFKAS